MTRHVFDFLARGHEQRRCQVGDPGRALEGVFTPGGALAFAFDIDGAALFSLCHQAQALGRLEIEVLVHGSLDTVDLGRQLGGQITRADIAPLLGKQSQQELGRRNIGLRYGSGTGDDDGGGEGASEWHEHGAAHSRPLRVLAIRSVENLRIVCAEHNRYYATRDFGASWIEHVIATKRPLASTRTNSTADARPDPAERAPGIVAKGPCPRSDRARGPSRFLVGGARDLGEQGGHRRRNVLH